MREKEISFKNQERGFDHQRSDFFACLSFSLHVSKEEEEEEEKEDERKLFLLLSFHLPRAREGRREGLSNEGDKEEKEPCFSIRGSHGDPRGGGGEEGFLKRREGWGRQ